MLRDRGNDQFCWACLFLTKQLLTTYIPDLQKTIISSSDGPFFPGGDGSGVDVIQSDLETSHPTIY
jgi:hypothetical protein